ncbi:MAG TPA: RNA-binding protein [Cytophagales bacterium]|nr:RNA-binding protein [Cytophagales bacterium]
MKIFVGNLSQNMDEKTLNNIFEEFGLVKSVTLVKDFYTNRSRGFAFVEMFSSQDALAAIESLNNKTFLGKRIVVNKRERV